MTLGEYRVGVNFNPSKDNAVDRLKALAAAFIDECARQKPPGAAALLKYMDLADEKRELYDRAMRDIESGAMWAVKAATKPPRQED